MKNTYTSLRNAVLLTSALALPFAINPTVLIAQDHPYHDAAHNDDHKWDSHEDKAYRAWAKENHRKAVTFSKLKADDQQNYWNWRHEHPDSAMKH